MEMYAKRKITVIFQIGQGELGDTVGPEITVADKRCSATIIAYNGDMQGQLHLSVWGMTLDKINELTVIGSILQERRMNRVTVQAGDVGGAMTTIYDGQIEAAYGDFQASPDNVFNVLANSAAYYSVDHADVSSFQGDKDVAEIMSGFADKLGYTFENNDVSVILKNAYYSGSSIQQIKDAARDADIYWTIDRGVLAIWPKTNGFRQGDAVQISPETGMVGYPAFSSAGIIVTTLFNPEIKQGGLVDVTSDMTPACGRWKVMKVAHTIESEIPGGQWFTQATCLRDMS